MGSTTNAYADTGPRPGSGGPGSGGRHRRSRGSRNSLLPKQIRTVAAGSAVLLSAVLGLPTMALTAHAAVAPVGQGFTVTAGDLAFILKQIKIAERHARDADRVGHRDPCGDRSVGSRRRTRSRTASRRTACAPSTAPATTCSPGRETFAAADQPFPRLTTPVFRDAGADPGRLLGPARPARPSYAQKTGNVFDTQPRVISNLIVDQTSTNPAAIAAAGFPVRTQGNPGVHPCTTDPDPPATRRSTASRPAACRRTRRCSSRT